MNLSKTKSIQKDLFKNIVILSVIILIFFGILFTIILYKTGISNVNEFLKQKNIATKNFIGGYFTELYNSVEFLSKLEKVKKAASLPPKQQKEVLDIYKSLKKTNKEIKYIYSGYNNGLLLINNYIAPKNYNPVTRPWYQAAVKSYPHIARGTPYQEIKTKEWLISISKALTNDKNNIIGVIAIDSSLDNVIKSIKISNEKYGSTDVFIIKNNGEMVINKDKNLLDKNFFNLINTPKKFNNQYGSFNYTFYGVKKIAYYSKINKLGWLIITSVNKSDIINPIIMQIFLVTFIVAVISIFLGWILSKLMTRQFVEPLIKIEKRIKSIIEGNSEKLTDYKYPENEIGLMAKYIEQLTETELYNKNLELQKMNEELKRLSSTDQLTKLFNRRKMHEELDKEYKRASRYKNPFSIIMFDIDFFKKINDTFGHQAGDAVLSELSHLVKKIIRATDVASRWGGEEFLILCPETNLNQASILAEKIRSNVENYNFPVDKTVTVSIGVSEFRKDSSIENIIEQADERLYKAKNSGRNKVVAND